MPSSTRKRLRQRRVLAFVWAIIRHGWAITATFLGSFLLSVPGWIDPLLSYAQKQELNRWTTVSPHTYRYLAIAFFAAGLLYASFLAWNEERDEVERLATELARANAGNEEIQAMHE